MATVITKTVKASTGDYTSISAAIAGEIIARADLVSADETLVIECYDDWPTGLVDTFSVAGFTTDATRFVTITSPVGERHNGTPDTGFYVKATTAVNILSNASDHTRIEYLDFEHAYTGSNGQYAINAFADEVEVHGCIMRSTGGGSALRGLRTNQTNAKITCCLALDFALDGFTKNKTDGYMHNNIAKDCGNGFTFVNAAVVASNNIAYGCTTSWANDGSVSGTNNAADDATTDTPPGSSPVATDLVSGDFNDAANDDMTPLDTGTAHEAGTDLSGTFTTDITAATFPANWNIGPFGTSISSDSTAPILTAPSTTNATATTIDGTVSTDEDNGTLYTVFTTSGTAPSVAQIQAGQDNSGTAAAWSGSQAVSATGSQTVSASLTLVPGTQYYPHYQQEDAATNDSTVVTGAAFTLTALPVSAIYSGGTIPSDSILHYAAGTSDSGSDTTMVDAGLVSSDDEFNLLILRNDTDVTSVTIVDSVASTDTLTFNTGSVDFTSNDVYAVVADIANPDVMFCEGTVTVSSESVTIDWYIQDVSPTPDQYSEVYTQTITGLTGVEDGNYTVELSTLGVLTLTAVETGGSGGISSVTNRRLIRKQRTKQQANRKKREESEVNDHDIDVAAAFDDIMGKF